MSRSNFFNYWDSFLAWRMKSWPLSSVYSPCSDLIEDPVSVQRHAYSDSSEQQETQSHLFDLAKMIVGYLLLGVFALCGASRPPRRGAFAPVPEINLDTPLMVEGDIAVTESSLGSGTHLPGRVINSAEIPSIKHNPWGSNASKILLWIPLIKISGCRCLFLPSSCAEAAGGSQGHLVCPHPLTIFKDQSHTRKVLLLHVRKFNKHDYEMVWGNTQNYIIQFY